MTQFIYNQESTLELHFPIMLMVMSEQETKEYHLKRLYDLSTRSLGQIPQLEEPNQEQKQWIERKMRSMFQ